MSEELRIVPYDPTWPSEFESEASRTREALGSLALRIDHNGSTSIPGLAAKPIIDIQVSVYSLEPIEAFSISPPDGRILITFTSSRLAVMRNDGHWHFVITFAITPIRHGSTNNSKMISWRASRQTMRSLGRLMRAQRQILSSE